MASASGPDLKKKLATMASRMPIRPIIRNLPIADRSRFVV